MAKHVKGERKNVIQLPAGAVTGAAHIGQSASALLFERATAVMPGGNTRTTVFTEPHPIYARSGHGCRIVDVDGTERIDFLNNYTALIHGHAHPRIVAAVAEQLQRGTCFPLPTESEVELAELLSGRGDSFERMRFTNSGSEAVMTAIKAARAYTGRRKIAKCEGAYHGSYDYVEVSLSPVPDQWTDPPASVPYARGTPTSVLDEVVAIRFNDVEGTRRILEAQADELATVIVDPLPNRAGLVPASRAFLSMLRDVTRAHGVALIFDEVISFRLGFNGAQGVFEVAPDLTTLGKIIGGGFPIGAVAGNKDIMSVFDPRGGTPPVPHGGTFNANPVSMVAGKVAMELLTPEEFERLNRLGEMARKMLREVFTIVSTAGQVTGMGSLLRLHFTPRSVTDYRSSYVTGAERDVLRRVHRYLLDNGILISPTGLVALSTPMTAAELDRFAETLLSGLRSQNVMAERKPCQQINEAVDAWHW